MDGEGWANFAAPNTNVAPGSSKEGLEEGTPAQEPVEELDDFGGFETAEFDERAAPSAVEVPSWALLMPDTVSSSPPSTGSSHSATISAAPFNSDAVSNTAATSFHLPVTVPSGSHDQQEVSSPQSSQGNAGEVDRLKAQLDALELTQVQEKKETSLLQKTLDELRTRKAKLEEDYNTVQSSLLVQKESYVELQVAHQKEMDGLREASYKALTTIVEEYKELSRTAVLEQQEFCQNEFKQKLQQELQTMSDALTQQKKASEEELIKEKAEQKSALDAALQVQAAEYKTLIQSELEELKTDFCKQQKGASERHGEELQSSIKEALKEERHQQNAATTALKEEFASAQQKMTEEHREAVQKAVKLALSANEENTKAQQSLFAESLRSTAKNSSDAAREEMEKYVEVKLQNDKASTRRSAAAVDVFLEGAQKQLHIIMGDSPREHKE